jgi:alkylation response protein AidB-like acyl-CoA dehydrogenase
MQLGINDVEEAVAKTFAVILEREATIERVRAAEQSDTGTDNRLWRVITEAGALDIALPSETGGLQLASIVAEMIGEHLAPVPFTFATCAYRFIAGAGPDCEDLASEIGSGKSIVTVVPAAGRLDTDLWLAAEGAIADAVLNADGEGVWLYRRPDGVIRADTLDAGSTALWPIGVPTERRKVESGSRGVALWEALQTDIRVLAAAELIGMANRSIALAAEYACGRVQFGRPIGSYQGVSHPLADCATAVEGARLLVRKAGWAVDEQEPDRDAMGAMAFVNAWEVAQKAVSHALRVHGGYGFMTEYDIGIYYRRAKALPLLIGSWQSEQARLGRLLYGSRI